MALPTVAVNTSNLDSDADSPKLARADLLDAVNKLNSIILAFGVASGIPTLDASGLLSPSTIPGGAFQTGMGMDYWGASLPTGWVFANGQTIGNASSGATGRANADCQSLFYLLWNSMADAQATVSGGRGASAAADWSAGKTITLPDKRGRVSVGDDNMGGVSAAGRVTSAGSGIDGTILGNAGGAETHTLTAAQIPPHTHPITALSSRNTSSGGSETIADTSSNTTMNTSANTGGGGAHNNMQPSIMCNYIIKL